MTDLKHYKMLIDGEWVGASDGAMFESFNPTTGKVWAMIPEATAEDVDRAVRAADRAFNHGPWSSMTATQRGHCLRKLADLLVDKSVLSVQSRPSTPANCSRKPAGRPSISPSSFTSLLVAPTRSTARPCRSTNPTCLFSRGANRLASLPQWFRGTPSCFCLR